MKFVKSNKDTKGTFRFRIQFFLHYISISLNRCQFATLIFVYLKTNWKKNQLFRIFDCFACQEYKRAGRAEKYSNEKGSNKKDSNENDGRK